MLDNSLPADVLREIGMPPRYKGYAYLLFMLQQTQKDPDLVYNLCNGLYPLATAHFQVPGCNLERNIRFAINRTWEHGNQQNLSRLFAAYDIDRTPSISEFLAILTEAMLFNRTRSRVRRRRQKEQA